MFTVGYLGPEATFTNMAVSRFFPEAEHVPYRTIPDCIDAAANENVDFAVVPLENAIEGSVNITVDYLVHEQPLSIVGEITVPIQQHLLVHPQYAEVWDEVYAVHSHPHAIAYTSSHTSANENVDFAVVPLENAIEGSVNITVD
ncbi:prephenate dehydratase domain-containing protein, partial [Bacillus sp. SS-TM]